MPLPSLSSCPDEVLAHIFSFLQLHVDHVDPYTLQTDGGGLWAVCLTSRRFYQVGLPILAEAIWAESPTWQSACRFFLRHPHLRSKVKQLRVEDQFDDWYCPRPRGPSDPFDHDEKEALIRSAADSAVASKKQVENLRDDDKTTYLVLLIHWFPNLDFLGCFPGSDDLAGQDLFREILAAPKLVILSHLREASIGPTVSSLDKNYRDPYWFAESTKFPHALLRIPTLKVLRLTRIHLSHQPDGRFVLLPEGKSNVEEVYLTEVFCGDDGDEELAYIFRACGALRIVQMEECSTPNTFDICTLATLVHNHGSHLEELWWSSRGANWDIALAAFRWNKNRNLRCLYLSHAHDDHQGTEFPPIQQFPPLLEFLRLEHMIGTEEIYFRSLGRALPRRRKKPKIERDWVGLNDACEWRDRDSEWGDEEEGEVQEEDPGGESDDIGGFDEFNDSPVEDDDSQNEGFSEKYDSAEDGWIDYNNTLEEEYDDDDDDDDDDDGDDGHY